MQRVKDMTSGRPLKLIVTFALPLMLGNMGQQLYMVVDGNGGCGARQETPSGRRGRPPSSGREARRVCFTLVPQCGQEKAETVGFLTAASE